MYGAESSIYIGILEGFFLTNNAKQKLRGGRELSVRGKLHHTHSHTFCPAHSNYGRKSALFCFIFRRTTADSEERTDDRNYVRYAREKGPKIRKEKDKNRVIIK